MYYVDADSEAQKQIHAPASEARSAYEPTAIAGATRVDTRGDAYSYPDVLTRTPYVSR